LGVVLFKKGKNDDARKAFRHAIEHDPREPRQGRKKSRPKAPAQ
jgi:Tfp pilus assembly protein PilF